MTKFLYIADTHLAANPMGYQQQTGYPERLSDILSALREYLSANHDIDFILHGGDMIDTTTEDNIIAAANAFHFEVPVYLCLGNHDLTTPDSVAQWSTLAPEFFANGTPDYTIISEDCVIHVVPNHWGDEPYYWKSAQKPHFSSAQMERLSHDLSMKANLPHILLTHSPVYGLPVTQTGFSEPYHYPGDSFATDVNALATAHDNMECVLGAHNHMNMHVSHDGVDFVTISALVETPFEFKLFEVGAQQIEMSTISLQPALAFDAEYDTTRSYVQGRAIDRSFSRACGTYVETHDRTGSAHRTNH